MTIENHRHPIHAVTGIELTAGSWQTDAPMRMMMNNLVVDGTQLAGPKVEPVLTNDPGMGVIRQVDAGYERTDAVADDRGVRVPMREG